jgi:hypothetical protein
MRSPFRLRAVLVVIVLLLVSCSKGPRTAPPAETNQTGHGGTSPSSIAGSSPGVPPAKFKGQDGEIYIVHWAGCWSAGAVQVADTLNIDSTDPESVAQASAEMGYPPEHYQAAFEGCLDGFRWRDSHPPR